MTSQPPPTAQVLAEAAARRHASTDASIPGAQLTHEYEQRQTFRRLIEPGIFRPNSKEIAMDALKLGSNRISHARRKIRQTLSTMADNILREPENPKYRSFKRENDTIKRRLIQPRGALEYALALGFRPKVMDFQSYYVFNPSKMVDLRIGAAILKEAIDRETEKEERLQRDREEQKAVAAAVAQNIKLAFLDDRQRKMMRDRRERELREVRESARGSQSASAALTSSPSRDQSPGPMPGLGHTLATVDYDPGADQPPPYHD